MRPAARHLPGSGFGEAGSLAFVFLAALLAAGVADADCGSLPDGCNCTGSTLTSCSGYTGGATLNLQGAGITAIGMGAFSGLSDVTRLCVACGVRCGNGWFRALINDMCFPWRQGFGTQLHLCV